MTDPISDLLIRIKNGYQARKKSVACPFSKIKLEIAKVLEKEGYLEKIEEDKTKRIISLALKYDNKKPAITDIKRVSKPGLRIYIQSKKIQRVYQGLGISILSTPKGILVDKEARKQKLGGELLCQVW